MKIEYLEKDGRLHFQCCEKISSGPRSWRMYEYSGEVPGAVVENGTDAIKAYTENKVQANFKRKKAEWDALDRYKADTNFPVSVLYEGVILEGKIVSAIDGDLCVRLETPYSGSSHVHYGFAAAMKGVHIFKGGSFSEEAIQSAKELLIKIYKKQKHYQENKEVIDLAGELNNKRRDDD